MLILLYQTWMPEASIHARSQTKKRADKQTTVTLSRMRRGLITEEACGIGHERHLDNF